MLATADFVSRLNISSLWWFVLVSVAVAVVSNFVISFIQQQRIAARAVVGVPGPAGHWLKGHIDYVSLCLLSVL